MKKFTNSSEETRKLGLNFAKNLIHGDVLLLYGELGVGKTKFTQGLAEGLGIKDRILSPTFVLQRVHEMDYKDIKKLNHIDLYRIEIATEIESLGLSEIFEDNGSITVIEWADRLKNFYPNQGYKIFFEYLSDNKKRNNQNDALISLQNISRS